ncbi:MAG TPA: flagellar assembly protein FliH [Marinobacter sp.]|nr:flagellar assembly protein FliH [Marinobacter sp.]
MKDSSKGSTRVPKEQLTAYERWELPLLDARGNEVPREEERNIKPLTAADLGEIHRTAHEDGYNEGKKAGYQAGLAEGQSRGHAEGLSTGLAEGREQGEQRGYKDTRKELDAKLDRLEHLMGELLFPISRHEDELETVLLNLTTALARAVVYRELVMDSSQIQEVVRRALQALPSTADNVRIHVHPSDLELVQQVAERLEAAASIVGDDAILPGGCKLETRHSLVDFTVEKRFQRVIQDMLEQQKEEAVTETEDLNVRMDDLTDFHRDVLTSKTGDASQQNPPDSPHDQSDTGEGDDFPSG